MPVNAARCPFCPYHVQASRAQAACVGCTRGGRARLREAAVQQPMLFVIESRFAPQSTLYGRASTHLIDPCSCFPRKRRGRCFRLHTRVHSPGVCLPAAERVQQDEADSQERVPDLQPEDRLPAGHAARWGGTAAGRRANSGAWQQLVLPWGDSLCGNAGRRLMWRQLGIERMVAGASERGRSFRKPTLNVVSRLAPSRPAVGTRGV